MQHALQKTYQAVATPTCCCHRSNVLMRATELRQRQRFNSTTSNRHRSSGSLAAWRHGRRTAAASIRSAATTGSSAASSKENPDLDDIVLDDAYYEEIGMTREQAMRQQQEVSRACVPYSNSSSCMCWEGQGGAPGTPCCPKHKQNTLIAYEKLFEHCNRQEFRVVGCWCGPRFAFCCWGNSQPVVFCCLYRCHSLRSTRTLQSN